MVRTDRLLNARSNLQPARNAALTKLPGTTCAISNTGPLISAFQAACFLLFSQIFACIYTSKICVQEVEDHGYGNGIKAATNLLIVDLTRDEEKRAESLAEQIAGQPEIRDLLPQDHLGKAQAIILALRPEHQHDLLLIDERAARVVAKAAGLQISGFPGVLLLAAQNAIISPEELKARLERCRQQGTYYGKTFIDQVYEMAKLRRRIT
jgi:predicted nucleic acid-binding protein